MLPWVGQSPDLNPIENLWSYLSAKLSTKKYANVPELWDALRQLWASVPIDYIQGLIDSMPRRVNAVLKTKGGTIDY